MSDSRTILLVDNDPKDNELALIALHKHNLANRVVSVTDGEEALAYIFKTGTFASRPNGDPAVVLIELKLPKLGGIEVLQKIRSDIRTRYLPVVILTSSNEKQDVVESYRVGANAYVRKPGDCRLFVDTVREIGMFWSVLNQTPPSDLDRR